jgi:hypothetical protein
MIVYLISLCYTLPWLYSQQELNFGAWSPAGPGYARVAYGQTLSVANTPYVKASFICI